MGEYDRKIGYANKQTAALEYRCGAVWVKLLNKDSFIFVFSRPKVLFDRTVLHARLDPVEGGDVYLRFFGGGLLGGLSTSGRVKRALWRVRAWAAVYAAHSLQFVFELEAQGVVRGAVGDAEQQAGVIVQTLPAGGLESAEDRGADLVLLVVALGPVVPLPSSPMPCTP